jgi:hypothetical protein
LIGAYASVALLCVAALTVGQAVLALCGRREPSLLAAPVGLATLLVASGIAIKLPGHATSTAITLTALFALSVGVLLLTTRRDAGRRRQGGGGGSGEHPQQDCEDGAMHGCRAFSGRITAPLAAAGVALVAASLPFVASGHVGILGVGLVNDDMANHLLVADWLSSRVGDMPTLLKQGYPVGPHALADGVSSLLGVSLVQAFAGLTLALPVLTAMLATWSLDRVRALARVLIGALVALSYLGAAYLAQGAFKEPIEAFLLLGFALLLPTVRSPRDAIPAGVIAAGAVYAYSFPGLIWLAGTAAVYMAIARPRGLLKISIASSAVLLVLIAPELARLIDFSHFKAFSSATANAGGLGNLRHHLSPLEALGIWPTSEFRLAAADAAHPIAYYAGALLGAATLALGLPRWLRRHGPAVPAALAAAIAVYLLARGFGTVYTSAKALAIASPLVLLVGLGGLAGAKRMGRGADVERPRGARPAILPALALVFGLAAAASSFLLLRQAPVGPTTHADELAQFRPILQGHRVLFLGRDDFIRYELRGAKPFVAVRNYYDNYYVRPNLKLADVFQKFDFDSVRASDLARFPYVITTRAAYASGPPPAFRPLDLTADFVLWKRQGVIGSRHVLDEGDAPGAILHCSRPRLGGFGATFAAPPVSDDDWSPSATVESGSVASQTLDLPAGHWELSLQYDASRRVRVTTRGLDIHIPANLDYRGTTPYYPVGRISAPRSGPVRIEVSVERPPLAGRLLGAHSVAHLGAIAASPAPPLKLDSEPLPGQAERIVPMPRACGRYVDWYSAG